MYYRFQVGPGSDNLPFVASMPYYLAMGACYLGGLFLYTTRIPEKFIPGKVDNCVKYLSWKFQLIFGL